jgi:hypothetical protein
MVGAWRVQDSTEPIDASAAISLLRSRLRSGQCETWFESDSGELLAVVTNAKRAMVMLLREPGDAGEHAVDESAGITTSSGYVLANGQVDTYADCDTVRLADALELVASVIEGRERTASKWRIDR